MKNLKLGRAIAAGFAGTLLMTMMMMIGPSNIACRIPRDYNSSEPSRHLTQFH